MDREWQADTVRLLAALADAWLLEPDGALLARLAPLPPLSDAIQAADPKQLAVGYAEIFLQLVPPYASLFLSDDGMLNSDPAEEILREYVRSGFSIETEWRAGAADHLGVELHYLAWLLERSPARAHLFLNRHLLTWAPVCCLAVERSEVEPLYSASARLTLDVLLALAEDN